MYTKEDWERVQEKHKVYEEAKLNFEQCRELLEKRVGEIVGLICKIFGKRYPSWVFGEYFDDDDNYGGLVFPDSLEEFLRLAVEVEGIGMNIETESYHCDYTEGFPAKFLFMDNEEIKKFVRKQRDETKAYREVVNAKNKKEKATLDERKKELTRRLNEAKKIIEKELGIK
jgi:peptide methionine sulfoxide reductase MsrA